MVILGCKSAFAPFVSIRTRIIEKIDPVEHDTSFLWLGSCPLTAKCAENFLIAGQRVSFFKSALFLQWIKILFEFFQWKFRSVTFWGCPVKHGLFFEEKSCWNRIACEQCSVLRELGLQTKFLFPMCVDCVLRKKFQVESHRVGGLVGKHERCLLKVYLHSISVDRRIFLSEWSMTVPHP